MAVLAIVAFTGGLHSIVFVLVITLSRVESL